MSVANDAWSKDFHNSPYLFTTPIAIATSDEWQTLGDIFPSLFLK